MTTRKRHNNGVTLVELAVSMALLAVLTVGIALGVQAAMEASVSQQAKQAEGYLGVYMTSRLKLDLTTATSVTIPSPTTLVIQPGPDASGASPDTITWEFSHNTVVRNNADLRNTTALGSSMTVSCTAPCFSGVDSAGAATTGVAGNPVAILTLNATTVTVSSNDPLNDIFTNAGFTNNAFQHQIISAQSFQ